MSSSAAANHVYDHETLKAVIDHDPFTRRGTPEYERIQRFCRSGRYQCAFPGCTAPHLELVTHTPERKAAGRKASQVISYFRHKPSVEPPHGPDLPIDDPSSEVADLAAHRAESEIHLSGKEDIQRLAHGSGINIELERTVEIGESKTRRPDVTVLPSGKGQRPAGIEFQVSALDPKTHRERSIDLVKTGFTEVQWAFAHNRAELEKAGLDREGVAEDESVMAEIKTRFAELTPGHDYSTGPIMPYDESGLVPIDVDDVYSAYGYRSPSQLWFYVAHEGQRRFCQAHSLTYDTEARWLAGLPTVMPGAAWVRPAGDDVRVDDYGLSNPALDDRIALAYATMIDLVGRGMVRGADGTLAPLTDAEVARRVAQLRTLARDMWAGTAAGLVDDLLADQAAKRARAEIDGERERRLNLERIKTAPDARRRQVDQWRFPGLDDERGWFEPTERRSSAPATTRIETRTPEQQEADRAEIRAKMARYLE